MFEEPEFQFHESENQVGVPPARSFEAFELRLEATVADVIEQCRGVAPMLEIRQNTSMVRARASNAGPRDELSILGQTEGLTDGYAVALFALHDTVFQLHGKLSWSADGRFRLGRPFALFNLNRRQVNRARLAPGAAQLRFSTMVSGAPHVRATAVLDLGIDGIQVEDDLSETSIPEGASFPAFLELQGRQLACLARLQHRVSMPSQARCGLRIATRKGRDVLVELYLQHRFPSLIDRRDVDGAVVTDLFLRSGYLALRDGTTPSPEWLAEADTEGVSRAFCYRTEDGRLIGHISFTRSYSKAWLGHQIATLRDHREAMDCRRTLYLLITTYATALDGDDTCVYGFFDLSKRWHKTFFSGFADWVNDPSLVVIAEFDRFERVSPESPALAPLPPRTYVGAPEPEDIINATALIRAQLPSLVADSFDIHPESLTSDALHPGYQGLREGRTRELLVLKVDGQLAGAVLCETGPRSVSLFNLLNMAQFYLRTDHLAPSIEAQLALLSHVRGHYAKRGDEIPIIIAPPGTLAAASEPGTVLAETMGLIAKSGRAMRQYESFLHYQFAKQLLNGN